MSRPLLSFEFECLLSPFCWSCLHDCMDGDVTNNRQCGLDNEFGCCCWSFCCGCCGWVDELVAAAEAARLRALCRSGDEPFCLILWPLSRASVNIRQYIKMTKRNGVRIIERKYINRNIVLYTQPLLTKTLLALSIEVMISLDDWKADAIPTKMPSIQHEMINSQVLTFEILEWYLSGSVTAIKVSNTTSNIDSTLTATTKSSAQLW